MTMLRPRRRRRWLLVALALTTVLGVAAALFVTRTPTGRALAARSIRRAVGPPPGTAASTERAPSAMPLAQRAGPGTGPRVGVDVKPAAGSSANFDDGTVAPDPLPIPTPRPRRPKGLRGVSFVLLLGVDKSHPKVLGRTDAMIVAAFRHSDGKVAAFSVPRDLWVELPDVPGRGAARINAVARVGDVRIGPGEGMPLLRRVLERELGVRIDHYALIDFQGFTALVDELDGVQVEVECPIRDCFWLDGPDAPCTMMDIPAGTQNLDGAQALRFVRSRHGRGDRDRTRRQQAVLMGFARKARAAGLGDLRRLWQVASPYVQTDLDWSAAAYYASFALDNDLSEIRGMSIRHPMVKKHVTEDNKHVLRLDTEAYEAAFGDLFETKLPALVGRRACPDADAALTFRERRRKKRRTAAREDVP